MHYANSPQIKLSLVLPHQVRLVWIQLKLLEFGRWLRAVMSMDGDRQLREVV